jgi:hypothetical protein
MVVTITECAYTRISDSKNGRRRRMTDLGVDVKIILSGKKEIRVLCCADGVIWIRAGPG